MEAEAVKRTVPAEWGHQAMRLIVGWAVVVGALATVIAAWPVEEGAAGAGFSLGEVVADILWGWVFVLPFAVPGAVLSARQSRIGSVLGGLLMIFAAVLTFLGSSLLLWASKQTDDA